MPLVVDLDETLVRSDLLVETGIAYLARGPRAWWATGRALLSGKAALKATIARTVQIDPALLPYNPKVLQLIDEARHIGRPVYIASASDESYVAAVATHLGLDGWFASSATENLLGATKRQRLVETFGVGGFDYVGDSRSDLDVWPAARRAIAVDPSASTQRKLEASHADVSVIRTQDGGWRAWATLLRPHHWALNGLVFLPMLLAQKLDATSLVSALLAAVAFSIADSAGFILTDLVDIAADRRDPARRALPLAAGLVSVKTAAFMCPTLTLVSGLVALTVSWPLLGLVAASFALSLASARHVKRFWPIGMLGLAALCSLRFLAGAVAVPISAALLGAATLVLIALVLAQRLIEWGTRAASVD